MKNFYYLFFVIVIFSCNKNNTANVADINSDSIDIYVKLAKDVKIDNPKRLAYNNRAYQLLSVEKNKQYNRKYLNTVATNFDLLGKSEKFKTVSYELLKKSVESDDTLSAAQAYKNLGKFFIDSNQNDSSFYYYSKAEKFSKYLRDTISLGDIYLDMAFIQLYESDFNGSEISASKSLIYLNRSSNNLKIYDAYNLIGINSNELRNYEKALEYHNKALNFLEKNNSRRKNFLSASSLNNIGYVYQTINKHEKAIQNFKLALRDTTLYKSNPSFYAMLIDNLAYSKFKLNDYSQLPQLFLKSLKIRDSLKNDNSGIILNKIHLSELYAAKKDTLTAQKFAKEALDFSRTTKVSADIMVALQQLSAIEHTNAVSYSKEYIKISDSVQQAERQAKDKFARIAFETDEIILQKDKLAEQNRSLLYFFIATLFIGVLLFVIRTQRAKNRELLLRQAQQKANEDIYNLMISQQETIEASRVKEKKRIAQELHDGVLGRLFGARLNLDSLNRFNDEESVASRFNYLTELKNIEQDIREISHDLNREKYVLINNFLAIVNNLIEEQRNSFDPEIELNIDDKIKWEAVSNAVKINLYRILQESLQNINKYANANRVTVDFVKNGEKIILKITDDGAGFEVATRKKGIGLQNMLSRANECDGEFDIKSNKNKGTTIKITVPVENKTQTTA